jgi:hypothetical protein
VLRLVARATTITMEMTVAMQCLKVLCLGQVVQLGELGPYHNSIPPLRLRSTMLALTAAWYDIIEGIKIMSWGL